jgi:hypothetical protein
MRQIRFAAMALGLASVLLACQAGAESPGPSPLASTPPVTAPPSRARESSAAPSPAAGAAEAVLDAALATQADETLRFSVDVRSADPSDTLPPVTGTGQVSFGDPATFRFASPGVAGTVPPSEVISDGTRLYSRGRDTPYLPPETWVVLEITPGSVGHQAVTRQYGDYSLVLVPPLGVTSALRAGEETIDSRAVTRYLAQVDVAEARPHLPDSLLTAYDSQMAAFRGAGVPLTHDVEVWIDSQGRIARTRYQQELEDQVVEAFVVTYDFDGYGNPMEAEPAPGDEVLTMEQAQERYQQTLVSPSPS